MATVVGLVLYDRQTAFAIPLVAAQIVQVGDRDRRQALVLGLAVVLVLALENASRGRSAEGLMGLVHGSQQLDVGPRVTLPKAVPPVGRRSYLPLA